MKMYSINLIGFLAGIVISSTLFNSCDIVKSVENSGPCGNRMKPYLYNNQGEGMRFASHTNFIVDGLANVGWIINCTNVCTAEHSKVKVKMIVSTVQGITVEATVLYGILRERPITLSSVNIGGNTIEYTGSDNFGIKDYYGDSPGEFSLILTMYFPSANTSWAADSMFVADNVVQIRMDAEYSKVK